MSRHGSRPPRDLLRERIERMVSLSCKREGTYVRLHDLLQTELYNNRPFAVHETRVSFPKEQFNGYGTIPPKLRSFLKSLSITKR